MMKYIKSIALLSLSLLVWTSCENDGFYYQDEARVRLVGPKIWALGTDSLTFTFVSYPTSITTMQMDVEACVMGNITDYDRTVSLTNNASKTTAAVGQYEYPATVTIPAGCNKTSFPVTLKRDATMEAKAVRLYLEVAASNDFAIGNNEENHLILIWSDMISKPANWSSLERFFGTYSDTKYRFMLNTAGVTEFDEDWSYARLSNYNTMITNALNEYNRNHPNDPLRDEDGLLVEFPVQIS